MEKFVIYRRVSGGHNQIKSGYGLDVQTTEINSYLSGLTNYKITKEFSEIASGKDHKNRPVLQEAIETAIKTNSILIISRICRLSRDLEYWAGFMKNTKVKFRIATNPSADNFMIAIYAAMVMKDREEIARRTKSALREARKRGVKLGVMGSENIKKANEIKVKKAKEFANTIKPIIIPLRKQGLSYKEIANRLNLVGISTMRGKSFAAGQVQRYATKYFEE